MTTPKQTEKKRKRQVGRPAMPLPRLNATPEALARELLKQRPLVNVEEERRTGRLG